jgi:type VI secretion system ImpM family protein
MTQTIVQAQVAYFGKIPSRGDFVKSANNVQLLSTLDQWISQGMELLAEDPRWKIVYDAAQPLHFAFLGSRSKLAIAGHLITSSDASQRRFPFLAAAPVEISDPINFIARGPLALSALWIRLEGQVRSIATATEATDALQALGDTQMDLDVGKKIYETNFGDFISKHTLGSLNDMLNAAGHEVSLRRMILALGLLLQPVMASGSAQLEKGLILPLPAEPMYRFIVSSFWLELISGFLSRADFELAVFIGNLSSAHQMVLGFSGSSAKTLYSVIDPHRGAEQNISIDNPEWVEDQIHADYGIAKLASYLEQPDLSLRSVLQTFRETFIGE